MAKMTKLAEQTKALVPANMGSQEEAAQAEVQGVAPAIKALSKPIRSEDDYRIVGDILVKIATVKKSVTTRRLKVTRLLDIAKKDIMQWWAPMVEELDKGRELGDSRMREWREEKERIAEEAREAEEKREERRLARLRANEQKKIEAAKSREERARVKAAYRTKKEDVKREQQARSDAIVVGESKVAGVSTVKRWQFEQILGWEQIAIEFLDVSLNRQAIMDEIKLQVKAGRKDPSIRGLRIWQQESSAVRSL